MAPVEQPIDASPTPWLTTAEYDDHLEAAIDGDRDALVGLFFGPAPE